MDSPVSGSRAHFAREDPPVRVHLSSPSFDIAPDIARQRELGRDNAAREKRAVGSAAGGRAAAVMFQKGEGGGGGERKVKVSPRQASPTRGLELHLAWQLLVEPSVTWFDSTCSGIACRPFQKGP